MQQLGTLWRSLNAQRRMIVIVATVAMFAAVLSLARMASQPSMTLLYAGLESGPAGEVVTALEAQGAAYEIRGGSIFVDSARRDELRMTLASDGLPTNASGGYELLDNLTGFGTTSQMFDAAYWRAKEGELARTIVAHPAIQSARVHLAGGGSNPFQRDVTASASVSVTTNGSEITPKHARALKFLVASAVAGLTPDDVSIIDGQGALIGASDETPSNTADDRADAIRSKVERLLAARVGAGNAVVELSLDTVTQTEQFRERRIDPESRVAISTDTEERSDSASDQGSGDVTVASNLPEGDGAGGDSSSSQTSETRERVNYEISETEREVTMAPGAIKRLTVAVLVNGTTTLGADGTETFEPRSEQELAALQELVASAVGFDEARGDVITLKTMQFEPAMPEGTAAQASLLDRMAIDVMSLIQAAVLAIVALILGLFVVRPLLSTPAPEQTLPALAPPPALDDSEADTLTPLTGEIDDGAFTPMGMSLVGEDAEAENIPGLPDLTDTASDDPVERLRALIGERQEETVEILRNWLEGEEETV